MAALLAGLWLPVWIGRYAPLWDYANHLLEAQVAAHYDDPAWGYAEGYRLRHPLWFVGSNALGTLALSGLGQMLPMDLAGRLVLSIHLALFLSGLWRLLRRTGAGWPLLLLAPVLAYNFTFTGGFLNFSLGIALGLHALTAYLRWQAGARRGELLALAGLMLLIYFAHLAAWGFMLAIIAGMAAVEAWPPRRLSGLLLALTAALPFVLLTRPALGLAALLAVPGLWAAAALLRRWQARPVGLAVSGALGVAAALLLIRSLRAVWQPAFPDVRYNFYNKATFPLRTFILPHQYYPADPLLTAYNLLLLVLLAALAGLLAWHALRQPRAIHARWYAALGLLAMLYPLIPTRMEEITFTEPRVLLFLALLGLSALPWPPGDRLRRAVTGLALGIGLLSMVGISAYSCVYAQKTAAWDTQLERLRPAQRVFVLQERAEDVLDLAERKHPFNTFHSGLHYNNTYALKYGGFVSRIFINGPVRLRYAPPLTGYFWLEGHNPEAACSLMQGAYDAVLFWGRPNEKLGRQLDACFGEGEYLPDMVIWKVR